MLNVVTVQTGNYCGRGKEYTKRLFDGFRKHLKGVETTFWCLTDDFETLPHEVLGIVAEPNVVGWWNKLSLFSPGKLPKGERVLYSDLDAMVIGDLTDIASYQGKFAAIRDFYYHNNIQSCLMAWEAGTLDEIYNAWVRGGRPQFDPRGDQAFIESQQGQCDYWQDMFPGQVMSYKECRKLGGVPSTTRMLCFHGRPRPHEINFSIEEM